jgi:NADPH-dependent ferric siderophore reductase
MPFCSLYFCHQKEHVMANMMKKAVDGLLERLLKPARVLDIREWDAAPVFEIDISFPAAKMLTWNAVKRLKCKVGMLEYRDYTPARWDGVRQTCTLIVEAGHRGVGSRWVRELQVGDEVLLDEAHAANLPSGPGQVLGLGDGSAIGHFIALKNLLQEQNPLDAALFLPESAISGFDMPGESFEDRYAELGFVRGADRFETLRNWLLEQDLSLYSFIYLAGNIPMIKKLRAMLKERIAPNVKIYAHGFWS